MGFLTSFRRVDAPERVADSGAIVSRYKRLRTVGREVGQKLVTRLPKDVLEEGARKLGMLRKGVFVFETEDETAVLMDYCLYDVRRRGLNAIEQYLVESPPDPESDEMECLRAMQHATYSLCLVESVVRGVGVNVRDILSQETFLIVDIGLSSTVHPGLFFLSRILHYDGFASTGGAAIPLGVLPADRREAAAEKLARSVLVDSNGYFDPAPLIRECVQGGASSRVRYQDFSEGPARQPRGAAGERPRRFTKNSPCACGSGKKYKQCCMKRIAKGR